MGTTAAKLETPRLPQLSFRPQRRRLEAETRKMLAQAKRAREQRLHAIEMRIAALEAQRRELAVALEYPPLTNPAATPSVRKLSSVCDNLAQLTKDWEEAAAKMASVA